MKMPLHHVSPHRSAHKPTLILLLAVGMTLTLVSCSNNELGKNFHYPPPAPIPMHQPPFAPPISPPWNRLVKEYPGLSQAGSLWLNGNSGIVGGTVDNNGVLTNRVYYKNPICTPADLKFVSLEVNGKTVTLHQSIEFSASVRNISRRACSILGSAPFPGTNGSTLGDCLPAYIVRDSSGRVIHIDDSASYYPPPQRHRLGCGMALDWPTLILPGKSTNHFTGFGGLTIGSIPCVIGAGPCPYPPGPIPPPGRYSVTAIIPSGAYVSPTNCASCEMAPSHLSLIGRVEPIYSPPFYFTIKY